MMGRAGWALRVGPVSSQLPPAFPEGWPPEAPFILCSVFTAALEFEA